MFVHVLIRKARPILSYFCSYGLEGNDFNAPTIGVTPFLFIWQKNVCLL